MHEPRATFQLTGFSGSSWRLQGWVLDDESHHSLREEFPYGIPTLWASCLQPFSCQVLVCLGLCVRTAVPVYNAGHQRRFHSCRSGEVPSKEEDRLPSVVLDIGVAVDVQCIGLVLPVSWVQQAEAAHKKAAQAGR